MTWVAANDVILPPTDLQTFQQMCEKAGIELKESQTPDASTIWLQTVPEAPFQVAVNFVFNGTTGSLAGIQANNPNVI